MNPIFSGAKPMRPFRSRVEVVRSRNLAISQASAQAFRLVTMFSCLVIALSTAAAGERDAWTTSRVKGSPDPPKPFHVRRAYPKLQFTQPVELMALGDTGKMMLLEVDGKLFTFDDDDECESADLALDLKPLFDPFHRAFGFAIHPDFAQNRQIFVAYAGGPVARADGTRLSRFVVEDESPPRIDPASEQVLLTWPSGGHNGCAIRFDSGGLLYFSTGDGSRPYPPDEYDVSQDLSDLRSTICRIDVDRTDGVRPYSIPADNPFVDQRGARPEIWAYGFRNPWRFTIDPLTDRIFCGDVGWELWEMIFEVRRAGNYGWSIVEGPQPIRDDIKRGPTEIQEPLVSYPHALGQSVTGGHVYRGTNFPTLKNAYVYGDYVTGLIWALRHSQDHVAWNPVVAESGLKIITFAESRDHEVLVVDFDGGIYELVENKSSSDPADFPTRLSETGLFESTAPLRPAAGVMPYRLIAESTQEGTVSEYVVAIPDRGTVRINKRQRAWRYPAGTVFARTIRSDSGTKIETQIIHFDGSDWKPYSFAWNADQSDAELVGAEGATIEVSDASGASFTHRILSRAQCRTCHSRQNGGAVGFTLANLDRPLESNENQLDRMISDSVIDRRAPKAWNIRPFVDPHDSSASLQARARSYLSVHCAHCHVRGGGGTVPLDLSYENDNDGINAINFASMQGNFGISDAKVITPGDPSRSVLFYRMATSGTGHMPKLGARDNDLFGLNLIHDWIASLGKAPANEQRNPVDAAKVLEDTSASLQVFAALMKDADRERRRAMAEASENGNPVTRGLFERYLPEQRRRKTLGESIDSATILAMTGDQRRGREIFYAAQSSQCVQCHRLQGGGKSVGPDLDAIASKRNREQLLNSIVSPSKEIEPKFRSHAVLTEDGTIVTGLKVAESDDVVVIRQPNGKDQTISQDDVVSSKVQSQSLMPTGLAAQMTAQELADLLAFLESLK